MNSNDQKTGRGGPNARWKSWIQKVISPRLDEQTLERKLRLAHDRLPTPVFWLFGKAQSGKTSIIRALTGSTDAEIGNGFRPCTRTSRIYPFPSDEEPLIEFLDTRGLGEVNYDPREDLQIFTERAHVLIVVVKALDHAQAAVLEPLDKIIKSRRDWPVIVAQTCLHEAYTERQHPRPYPFRSPDFPPSVPADLARSLSHQREWFRGRNVRFVPLDFTLLDDGFDEPNYGLDALWMAIEDALPWGLRAMLQHASGATGPLRDEYRRVAERHILSYALAAGASAALPVPMIDLPLIMAIQAKLCHSVASIYGQELSPQRVAEIGGTLGAGFFARLGGRELLKFVPGWGSAVAATYAAATTYALGRIYVKYFESIEHGYLPDADSLKQMYEEEFQQGRRMLKQYLQRSLSQRGKGK